MKNKMKPEVNERVKQTIRDIIKAYWDGEGSNTYTFCVLTYICLFTMASFTKVFGRNLEHGSMEQLNFLATCAIITVIEFILLYIFYSICKKQGNKEIFIKIMNYLAIATTILTILLNVLKI